MEQLERIESIMLKEVKSLPLHKRFTWLVREEAKNVCKIAKLENDVEILKKAIKK